MKIKHISIKDFPIRILKKGKKRGRPSKEELTMSKIMSFEMQKPSNKKSIKKFVKDLLFYGTGIVRVTP